MTHAALDPYAPEAVFARIRERLPLEAAFEPPDRMPPFGDHTLNPDLPPVDLAAIRAAAVLVPLVPRGATLDLLLTRRTATLRDHAGQVSFPGGKIEAADASPAAAALREAHEEIGLDPSRVAIVGVLGSYLARSGYRIVPVVARLAPPLALALNPAEVAEVFEVPFAAAMGEPGIASREWRGAQRRFYTITHGGRTVWGITAGIIRTLAETLYGEVPQG